MQLTDGLRQLLKKEKIYGYTFEGKRHDTGDKLGFLKATVEFALKRDDLGADFREYSEDAGAVEAGRGQLSAIINLYLRCLAVPKKAASPEL